ncbi:helix-turn-helix domain-containing protein [Campylobacter concisus]|uniref:helix-turn-helix domain-containing protein n=1 Tax=Campylobacter concisus TaxID=199 RepID=UPI000CD950F3|nr:helix-turn-helix transcriptional regulator [Campylobacter concisus]
MYESINSFSEDEILKFYENISKRVRELRENHKISQLDMALSIDIKSAAFYSNCENNKYGKHFNLEHLYKISKILNISLNEFFI